MIIRKHGKNTKKYNILTHAEPCSSSFRYTCESRGWTEPVAHSYSVSHADSNGGGAKPIVSASLDKQQLTKLIHLQSIAVVRIKLLELILRFCWITELKRKCVYMYICICVYVYICLSIRTTISMISCSFSLKLNHWRIEGVRPAPHHSATDFASWSPSTWSYYPKPPRSCDLVGKPINWGILIYEYIQISIHNQYSIILCIYIHTYPNHCIYRYMYNTVTIHLHTIYIYIQMQRRFMVTFLKKC